MQTKVGSTVHAALEGRRLLTHPFYRRWENGGLAPDELARYAEQYRFFESYLPEFLTQLAARLDDGPTRDAVLSNLNDEVAEPSHLSLFDLFAQAYGARDAAISPAMEALLLSYQTALVEGDAVAVAGLLAYEVQGAAIAESKRDGLVRHYGGTSPAIDFWTVHGSMEENHANWTMEGLEALSPSNEAVVRGTKLVAGAWWDFLSEREALALV
jgi:pyrroloquinoline quinone (PQQ) biosynthesis protein C